MEKEGLLERALELAGVQDIDFTRNPHFSRKYSLKGPDEAAIREFMKPALLSYFEKEPAYHLESNGGELVVFKTIMRRATVKEVEEMLDFSEGLARLLLGVPATAADKRSVASVDDTGPTSPPLGAVRRPGSSS